MCLRLPAPAGVPSELPVTACMPTKTAQVPMQPTKSEKYMLALIVINQMGRASKRCPIDLFQSSRVSLGQGRRRALGEVE